MKIVRDLERKLAEAALARDPELVRYHPRHHVVLDDLDRVPGQPQTAAFHAVREPAVSGNRAPGQARTHGSRAFRGERPDGGTAFGGGASPAEDRTELLVNRGRGSVYHPSLWHRRKFVVAVAVTAVLALVILLIVLLTGGASWPSSVATVQAQITIACQNPDVMSEPGQINFACAKGTQQVLWVFALLSSSDNPQFSDPKTGRMGLEPIAPAQGAEVAWSLNLHHPYNPLDAIDSLEVAARAINNIVGGASAISANGSPSVQPGLESYPVNCLRYTGSAAISTRPGFPSVCTNPVTSTEQQAELVADVYKKWAVGATPQQAQDAQVLFENAGNPGDQQVQAILKDLSQTKL